jgi:multisubunit Na+/H+ antiporter MnhE subunit
VIRFLVLTVLLTLVYLMVLTSFDPWDVLIGGLLSAALVLVFRGFVSRGSPQSAGTLLGRFLAFWPYMVAVVWDILMGAWMVVRIVLRVRPLVRPGIVAVPIEDRTPTGVAVSAIATTLSPGTFLVDVDWERRVMLIHAIDATDPDAVREAHQRMYRRYQRHVFP